MKRVFLIIILTGLFVQALSPEKPQKKKSLAAQLSEINKKAIVVQQLSDFITAHSAYRFVNVYGQNMLTADDWGILWQENNCQLRRLQNIQNAYWFEFWRTTYKERAAYIKAHHFIGSTILRMQQIIYGVKGSTGKTSFNEINKII